MTYSIDNALVTGLRDLYADNDVAKRLFDNFVTRKKDMRLTFAVRAAQIANAAQGDILALFRALDELGAGVLKLGRHGSKTRIEWLYGQASLGRIAMGQTSQPELIKIEDKDVEFTEAESLPNLNDYLIAHTFQLRTDLQVKLNLPVDLTRKEAERLAGFISQVPFDE